MRWAFAMLALMACAGSALAQSDISSHRDRYGNLVRDGGSTSPGIVNQGPANNGVIRNGPAQPSTGNTGPVRGTVR